MNAAALAGSVGFEVGGMMIGGVRSGGMASRDISMDRVAAGDYVPLKSASTISRVRCVVVDVT